jgi:hypothetical protein
MPARGPRPAPGSVPTEQSTKLTPSITAPGNVPNPRSGCQHKARGRAKRNPRNTSLKVFKPAERATAESLRLASSKSQPLSPASRAQLLFVVLILGLTPQALCCRALRALSCTRPYGHVGREFKLRPFSARSILTFRNRIEPLYSTTSVDLLLQNRDR